MYRVGILSGGIFLASLLLRFGLMSRGPYHLDALNLAVAAGRFSRGGGLDPLLGPGYPLTVILGGAGDALLRCFGLSDPVIAVNVMSAVTGAAAVVFFYGLARQFLKPLWALTAALMFSVNPVFLGISLYGKSHAPSVMFLLAGFLALIRGCSSGSRAYLTAAAAGIGLMGAARFQDMILVMPAVMLAPFVFGGSRRSVSSKAVTAVSVAAAATGLAGLFHLPFLLNTAGTGYAEDMSWFVASGVTDNFRGLLSPGWFVSLDILLQSLTVAGLIGAVFGAIALARSDRGRLLWLAVWLLVPVAFYGNLWTTVPRFFAFVLPVPLILLLFGVQQIWPRGRILRAALVLMIGVSAMLPFARRYPVFVFRHQRALLPDFARWVQERVPPGSLIITSDACEFYRYYGEDLECLVRPVNPYGTEGHDLEEFRALIRSHLSDGKNIFISDIGLYSYNPREIFSRGLQRHFHVEEVGSHLYESWHKGELELFVSRVRLYRVSLPGP